MTRRKLTFHPAGIIPGDLKLNLRMNPVVPFPLIPELPGSPLPGSPTGSPPPEPTADYTTASPTSFTDGGEYPYTYWVDSGGFPGTGNATAEMEQASLGDTNSLNLSGFDFSAIPADHTITVFSLTFWQVVDNPSFFDSVIWRGQLWLNGASIGIINNSAPASGIAPIDIVLPSDVPLTKADLTDATFTIFLYAEWQSPRTADPLNVQIETGLGPVLATVTHWAP